MFSVQLGALNSMSSATIGTCGGSDRASSNGDLKPCFSPKSEVEILEGEETLLCGDPSQEKHAANGRRRM